MSAKSRLLRRAVMLYILSYGQFSLSVSHDWIYLPVPENGIPSPPMSILASLSFEAEVWKITCMLGIKLGGYLKTRRD